jgi:DNA-binding PadR family transcriptional regulator
MAADRTDPIQPRDPNDLLPLKQSIFQILLALGNGEMHGYGIMQALTDKTGGRERILPGTLYASIARMVDEGLVEEMEPPDGDSSGGPQRRYYRTTPFGMAVARAESERLRVLLDLARSEKILTEPRQ